MYLVLDKSNGTPRRWLGDWPYIEGVSFWRGAPITKPVPTPIACALKPLDEDDADHGEAMPSILGTVIPLFRDDLIEALRACGADNIDYLPATVLDPDNGRTFDNYKAANIIGLVAAADLSQSRFTAHGAPIIDVDFDSLVIDPAKARGLPIFRLAESTNTIVVSEALSQALQSRGFTDIGFYRPEEIAT